jgi:glucose 1-dehydrogenase
VEARRALSTSPWNVSVDPLPLLGQWAVITGGSKGIGEGIAARLLAAGANVVLVARGQEALDDAVAAARVAASAGQQVFGMTCDVSRRDDIDRLFIDLRATIPSLHVFVANAGTGFVADFLALSAQQWDDVVALNLTGAFYGVQQAARLMVDVPTPNRAIVVVSSIRATGARPGRLVYAATKAAVNQAVRVAATEFAPLGIRINALSPGITETPLTALNPIAFAHAVANVPLGRAGLPSDLGEAALFLCSPASRFVTGINLVVDGGESLAS